MPAANKYNRTKACLNSKSTNFRTFRKSNLSETSLFSFKNARKKIDTKKILSFHLINKMKKDIIIEWEKGEKEIFLKGSFRTSHNFFSNQKKHDYLKLNLFKKLKFKSEGNIKINSVYLLSKKILLNKNKKNISAASTKEFSYFSSESYINFSFSKKNYCNYYPKLNEMKIISDKKPCHFPIECFHGANKFHEEIGSKEFLILDKNNVFNIKNESYKTIDRKDHIFLNHLFKKKSKISNNVINSVAIKYRHKNTTFIYYK